MRVWKRSFKTSCTIQSLTVHARVPEFSHNLLLLYRIFVSPLKAINKALLLYTVSSTAVLYMFSIVSCTAVIFVFCTVSSKAVLYMFSTVSCTAVLYMFSTVSCIAVQYIFSRVSCTAVLYVFSTVSCIAVQYIFSRISCTAVLYMLYQTAAECNCQQNFWHERF